MAKIYSDFDKEQRMAIGYAVKNRETAETFLQLLQEKDFINPIYQEIYDSIEKAYTNLQDVSALAVTEFLDEQIADNYTLDKYTEEFEKGNNTIQTIARTLRDNRLRKHIKSIATKLDAMSYESSVSAFEIIERLKSAVESLENKAGLVAFKHTSSAEIMLKADNYTKLISEGKQVGIPTGIKHFTEKLRWGGYALGELTVIGAVRSVGKTAILLQSLVECGNAEIPALYINLESTNESLFYRMSLRWTDGALLSKDNLQDENYVAKLNQFKLWYKTKQLFFESKVKDVNDLKVFVKTMVNKYGIKAVFVDYGNKIKNDKVVREQRYRALTITYEVLQELAIDYNIAVVVAHQLTQKVESGDYEPTLSDFKESGGVSDVADTCIMLWGDREALDVFCKIAKQKNYKISKNFLVRFDRQKQIMQNGVNTENFKSAF